MKAITILKEYNQGVVLLMILKMKKNKLSVHKNRIVIILFDDNLTEILLIQMRLIDSYR